MAHPKDRRTSQSKVAEVQKTPVELAEDILLKIKSLCEVYLSELNTLESKNSFHKDLISSNGTFPNMDEFLEKRSYAYSIIRTEINRILQSIADHSKQRFKTGRSPVDTFSSCAFVQILFYENVINVQSFQNIEPEFFNLISSKRKLFEDLSKLATASSQNNLLSYSEKSKATRMARALFSEGYDYKYIVKALTDKGYQSADAQKIIKAGQMEVFEEKTKSSRTIALVMGALWLIVLILFLIPNETPQSAFAPRSTYVPARFVTYGAAIFVFAAVRWAYYWFQSAKIDTQK